MDFNYKKYSLENLENWVHDAVSSAEATPHEIYETICNVVKEEYLFYKKRVSFAHELLALLNDKSFIDNQQHTSNVLSYNDMIANGWNMTGDGLWIKEETT